MFVLIALFFVYQPERTIGEASRWTNTMSLAFLSGANRGTIDDPAQAKRHVADQLFGAFVYQPWVVLEFGGLRHCVDTDRLDDDGYPRPVGPHDPARDVCRDHLRQGADGHGGYAPRFLRYPRGLEGTQRRVRRAAQGRDRRPTGRDGQFRGYAVDKTDSPAVDIQQEHGAYQRLTLAVVFFAGVLGAVVLLGFLSLAVILAQVVALVLLGFAPVALVIGIFPRAGHDFFRNWLAKLATAVFIKALYSLVIAIVVAVAAALQASTESLGLPVLLRAAGDLLLGDLPVPQADHRPAGRRHHGRRLRRADATDDGGAARGRRRDAAVRGAGRDARPRWTRRHRPPGERARRRSRSRDEQRRAGRATGSTTTITTSAPSRWWPATGAATATGPCPSRTPGASPPARPSAAANGNGSAPAQDPADPPAFRARARSAEPEHELSPRASHEDAMRRARELRERQRTAADDGARRS